VSETATVTVHGTCIALPEGAVLLRGAPGSGKSDLALRLLDMADARLVADDQVILTRDQEAGIVLASVPEPLGGLLEVRGVGVISLGAGRWVTYAPLVAVIDMAARPDDVPRAPGVVMRDPMAKTPGEDEAEDAILVRGFSVWPFEASAPAKVRLVVSVAAHGLVPLTEREPS
jgi:hypothetical protein